MGRSPLPKELRLCINRLANEKAANGGTLAEVRKAYQKEKLRLLEVVAAQFGAGVSMEDVMRNLGIVENRRRVALQKSLAEARQLVMEMD